MRVMIIGSGGREHALAAAVAAEGAEPLVWPGNPGIPWSTGRQAEETDADLFVIGPERPLVDGLADRLRARGRLVCGPGADGARLEGSKAWMKEIVAEAGIPSARHASFTELAPALAHLDRVGDLFVIETDGLADGKGVLVTTDRAEAQDAVGRYLDGSAFGDAGRRVVIEEGLTGPELSVLAVCDGTGAVALPAVRDHKRVGDGDTGPNTGGMGTFTPVPGVPEDIEQQVLATMVHPTLRVLRRRGIDYRGVLYAGLMLTPEGPKLLEYNVRFGDPEAQALIPRVDGGLTDLLLASSEGRAGSQPTVSPDAVVCVVLAAAGYPRSPRFGDEITGIEEAAARPGVTMYCAGVDRRVSDGRLVTAGGRVLNVCGRGPDLAHARASAYDAAARITWSGMVSRGDIGPPTH